MPSVARLAAKAIVLFAGCLIAGTAGLVAIGLWKAYGGATFAPEIFVAAFGHLLTQPHQQHRARGQNDRGLNAIPPDPPGRIQHQVIDAGAEKF